MSLRGRHCICTWQAPGLPVFRAEEHDKGVLECKPCTCVQGAGLTYSSKLMAVGRASAEGVLVHGRAAPLGMTGFEALAGSSAHRPAQFTFTSTGVSLQVGGHSMPPAHALVNALQQGAVGKIPDEEV